MTSSRTSYTVTGMTCDHCAGAVSEEVRRVAGVREVQVELGTGAVTVTGEAAADRAAIRAAVEEAGYELAAGRPEPA